jgi:hypothetical protein
LRRRWPRWQELRRCRCRRAVERGFRLATLLLLSRLKKVKPMTPSFLRTISREPSEGSRALPRQSPLGKPSSLHTVLLTALLAAACAASPAPPPSSPARVKDSAPEKIAAQRASARGLDLEADDARWGVEAARERRENDKAKQKAPEQVPAGGPVDLKQTASPAPTK